MKKCLSEKGDRLIIWVRLKCLQNCTNILIELHTGFENIVTFVHVGSESDKKKNWGHPYKGPHIRECCYPVCLCRYICCPLKLKEVGETKPPFRFRSLKIGFLKVIVYPKLKFHPFNRRKKLHAFMLWFCFWVVCFCC